MQNFAFTLHTEKSWPEEIRCQVVRLSIRLCPPVLVKAIAQKCLRRNIKFAKNFYSNWRMNWLYIDIWYPKCQRLNAYDIISVLKISDVQLWLAFFFTCGVNMAENSGILKALQFEVRKITNKAFLYHHKHSWRCHDFMTIYVNIWWLYIHKCWRAVLTRGHWQHHQLHFLIWKSGFGMTPFVSETAVVLNVRW